MKLILHIILITIVLHQSCNKSISESPLKLDVTSNQNEIHKLSEIASDVEYIPLETKDQSVINFIRDVKADNRGYFVSMARKILYFDKKGKYLFRLDKEGRGPEEYSNIFNWDISNYSKLLLIHSKNKILLYNITDNDFIYFKTINIKDEPNDICFVPDEEIILLSYFSSLGNESYRNVFINYFGDTISVRKNYYSFTPVKPLQFASSFFNINFTFNSNLFFKEITSDTVFVFSKDKTIKPYLILDTYGLNPNPKTFANISPELLFGSTMIQNIMETDLYIIYRLLNKKITSYGIYDKEANYQFFFNGKTLLQDDISAGVNFEPKFCLDNRLINWVDALTLKNFVRSETFINSEVIKPEKKESIKDFAEKLQDTDNPILISVTPKNY